jgi:mitochondrial import receptor subunit TOM40
LRYSEKVDFGTEIQLVTAGGRRDAVATVGGKFEFRRSTFRGQVDTTGKVAAVLEEKIVPGFSFLISGEMDHSKVRGVAATAVVVVVAAVGHVCYD